MDCSPPGSSIHGIFQARVLEWGAIVFSLEGPRAQGNVQGGVQLEDSLSLWERGAKVLRMQACVQKPQWSLKKRALQWMEPGWKG